MNENEGTSAVAPQPMESAPTARAQVADYHSRMADTSLIDNPFLRGKTVGFVMNFLKRDKGFINDRNFFEFIANVIGDEAAFAMARRVCRMDSLPPEVQKALDAGCGYAHSMLARLWNEPNSQPPLKDAVLAALAEKQAALTQAAAEDHLFTRRFAEIVRLFVLNEIEADMLLLAYVRHANIWRWTDLGYKRNSNNRYDRITLMCQALDIPFAITAKALWRTGRLRSLECLDREFDFNADLEPFLIGLANEPLTSQYFARVSDPALPWAAYGQLSEQYGTLLKDLIANRDPSRGLNILLYGPPGTGKTSFAGSLAAELGMDLYRIRVPEETEDRSANSRLAAMKICDGQVNRQCSIILIDEADALLTRGTNSMMQSLFGRDSASGRETGSLNTLLDAVKTPCIWITNSAPAAIAEASRRRFDYSIHFDALNRQQRRQVWINAVRRYGLQESITESLIDDLTERYPISAGGIDLALRHFSRLVPGSSAPGGEGTPEDDAASRTSPSDRPHEPAELPPRRQNTQYDQNAQEDPENKNQLAAPEFSRTAPESGLTADQRNAHVDTVSQAMEQMNSEWQRLESKNAAVHVRRAKLTRVPHPSGNSPQPEGKPSAADARELLEKLLRPHCELLQIPAGAGQSRAGTRYALEGLNVTGPTSPARVLGAIRGYRRRTEMAGVTVENAPPLNVLLSGPPGTGKTEFVKFLGRELDCPVETCMAGDLLSRYLGGTERNIREAFRTAAADRAILFIDEADGLFRSRAMAERSWEVTQVNELLHAMENFRGILLCATNSAQTLDPAAIRRFTFKLEFDYLTAAGKLLLYQRMLAELCTQPLDEKNNRRLAEITDAAPCDFHTVRQAMIYLGGDAQTVTHDELLAALEQETRAKRQRKGGHFGFGRE